MNGQRTATDRGKPWRIAVHLIIAGCLAVEGVSLVYAVQRNRAVGCTYPNPPLPDFSFVAWGVLALVVGSVTGGVHLLGDRRKRETDGSRAWGQVALACAYLLLAVTFLYEAVGLTNVDGLEPITYYVRCAVALDKSSADLGFWTYAIVATICFLVGHWLVPWHPRTGMAATPSPTAAPPSGVPSTSERAVP